MKLNCLFDVGLQLRRKVHGLMKISAIVTALAGALAVSSCGPSGGSTAGETAGNISGPTAPSTGQPSSQRPPLGVNVAGIQWASRLFMNLIYGSTWGMQDSGGSYSEVPASSLDANGWVKSAPAGTHILRALSVPLNAGKFICTYQGNGTLSVSGSSVSDVTTGPGSTAFSLSATYPDPKGATLSYTFDRANYIRNIDCREADGSRTATLAPDFASALSPFKTIRFMKWQTATEGNWPVTWATRNKPGDGDYTKNDGVPIEVIVQTADDAGADLWVTIPWNADNNYITRFTTYVRDHLPAGRKVYVEVSNEVWSMGYPVAGQATSEAVAENLPSASGSGVGGRFERYAEKTEQVMAIWSGVFSGDAGRLVRVASFLHVAPYFSESTLSYMNLSKSVDALATAPYFGYEATDAMSLDEIMGALPDQIKATVDLGLKQKAIADKYGLRYLTYEAGQGIVLANVALEQQVQRDPRMHDAYQKFLSSWQSQVGDGLNLFALEGSISKYGAWGLSEYIGQPNSQAPKRRAVDEYLGGAV